VKLTGKGVDIDKYGMTIVDLKELGYRDKPFVLAKNVTQVFYVHDMSSKPKKDKSRNKTTKDKADGDEPKHHIVLAGKKKIVGVDDVTDEEEYNKVEDMTPFAVEVDTSILLAQEEAPYARHDHNEGVIVKRTILIFH
jgi:predicted ribonuclease toxin of YeeF-YezG toxin-antitoxin module